LATDPATTLAMQGGTLNLSDEAAGVGNALAGIVSAPFTGKLDPVGDYRSGAMKSGCALPMLASSSAMAERQSSWSAALRAAPTAALSLRLAPKAAAVAAGKAGAVGGALAGSDQAKGNFRKRWRRGDWSAAGGYALGRYAPAAVERVLPRRFALRRAWLPMSLTRQGGGRRSHPPDGRSCIPQRLRRAGKQRLFAADHPGRCGTGARPDRRPGFALAPDRRCARAERGRRCDPGRRKPLHHAQPQHQEPALRSRRNLGGTSAVKTTEAQGQIDQELSQLAEAPETNAAEIGFLEKLKSDLSQPQTVGSIRRIRTSLRGPDQQANLTATTAEARAMRVLDAAKNDIQRDAPPAAASAYARADAFNRERQTHIDTVLGTSSASAISRWTAKRRSLASSLSPAQAAAEGGSQRSCGTLSRMSGRTSPQPSPKALAALRGRAVFDGAVRLSDEQAQPSGPQNHLRS
jgi:hypothetical protein